MPDPTITVDQAVAVSFASGTLGGLLGGITSLIVARINRETTLQAAEKSASAALTASRASNEVTLQSARENNKTTLEAIEISRRHQNEAEYRARQRDQLEAIGLEFVSLSEIWYEMISQALYLMFPKKEYPPGGADVAKKRLEGIDTHEVFVGIRKLRSRLRVLNRPDLATMLQNFITIHSNALGKIMAQDEKESYALQAKLMELGDLIIDELYKVHKLDRSA